MVAVRLSGMYQVLTKIAARVCVPLEKVERKKESWAQAGVKCINWDISERREPLSPDHRLPGR